MYKPCLQPMQTSGPSSPRSRQTFEQQLATENALDIIKYAQGLYWIMDLNMCLEKMDSQLLLFKSSSIENAHTQIMLLIIVLSTHEASRSTYKYAQFNRTGHQTTTTESKTSSDPTLQNRFSTRKLTNLTVSVYVYTHQ